MKLRSKIAALVGSAALIAGMLATASGAFASGGSLGWAGNGWPNDTCSGSSETMHWVFTGKGVDNVVFNWPDGPTADMTQHSAGSWYADVPYFDPTGLDGSDIFVTFDGSLTGHAVLTLSHCDGEGTPGGSSISSEVHDGATDDGNAIVVDNDNPAAMPATVHDSAIVTADTDLPDGSSVTFYFWDNNDCSGEPSDQSDPFDVSGASPQSVDPGLVEEDLGAGEYSFQANFTSGDTGVLDSAAGDCEPFKVRDFTGSELGETDVPSEPNTATMPTSGNSGPSDSSWLLVAALGVLLASVVVMTPSRAKNRR